MCVGTVGIFWLNFFSAFFLLAKMSLVAAHQANPFEKKKYFKYLQYEGKTRMILRHSFILSRSLSVCERYTHFLTDHFCLKAIENRNISIWKGILNEIEIRTKCQTFLEFYFFVKSFGAQQYKKS